MSWKELYVSKDLKRMRFREFKFFNQATMAKQNADKSLKTWQGILQKAETS